MEKVIIDGKEYTKIGDANKLPKQNFPREMLEHNQPERSKREDDIMYLKCGKCMDYYHVFLDKDHISRCGALNTDESQ